jgi:hypothetical protein
MVLESLAPSHGQKACAPPRIEGGATSTGPQAGQTINNNLVALSTTYTRAGVNRTVGAIDLEANGFFSHIPPEVVDEAGSPVTVTEAAQVLPQMNGSGMVRNLRAAMSLSGAAADQLEAAGTRAYTPIGGKCRRSRKNCARSMKWGMAKVLLLY